MTRATHRTLSGSSLGRGRLPPRPKTGSPAWPSHPLPAAGMQESEVLLEAQDPSEALGA